MELQEFTTFLREKIRSFDKAVREDVAIPPPMDLEQWIEDFKEWIK